MTMETLLSSTLSELLQMRSGAAAQTRIQPDSGSEADARSPYEHFARLIEVLMRQACGRCACNGGGGDPEGDGRDAPAPQGPATRTAPSIGLPEGLSAGEALSGRLHVYRAPGAELPWDGRGVQPAVSEYWSAALVPDARGLIGGQVAPGLEGWYELVTAGEAHNYYGYRDYLEQNYPGGYAAWESAFDAYRRVALTGAELEFSVADTSGMHNGPATRTA